MGAGRWCLRSTAVPVGRRHRRRRAPRRVARHPTRLPAHELAPGEPWAPRREPHRTVEVLDDAFFGFVGGLVTDQPPPPGLGLVRSIAHPAGAVRFVSRSRPGSGALLGDCLAPTAPRTMSMERAIGPHRRPPAALACSASLDDIRAIPSAFGGTINDVVLAAISGGYGALLSRGEDADSAVIRSLVPVSTRHDDGRGAPQSGLGPAVRPARSGFRPRGAARAVQADDRLKASHRAEVGEAVTSVGDLAPPMVVGALSRRRCVLQEHLPQRSVNTVTTNVPGPQFALYCSAGRCSSTTRSCRSPTAFG